MDTTSHVKKYLSKRIPAYKQGGIAQAVDKAFSRRFADATVFSVLAMGLGRMMGNSVDNENMGIFGMAIGLVSGVLYAQQLFRTPQRLQTQITTLHDYTQEKMQQRYEIINKELEHGLDAVMQQTYEKLFFEGNTPHQFEVYDTHFTVAKELYPEKEYDFRFMGSEYDYGPIFYEVKHTQDLEQQLEAHLENSPGVFS